MSDSNRWAQKALKHVRTLSKKIGPRGATSDTARRAAEYVRDEMKRMGLRDVRLEPFQGAVAGWFPLAFAFSVAAWGMLIGLLFGLVGGIVASALYLTAAWIVYRELTPSPNNRSVRRWLWQSEDQNVLGVAPPNGPVERRAVLMSYLDSARAPFFWRTEKRRRWAGRLVLPLFFSLLLSATFLLLGGFTSQVLFYFLAFLLVFPHCAALIICLFAERSPFSPGANNNASGVGVLLALGEQLKQSPLARTEVWLLTTGCRETGGDGVRTFLDTYRSTLDGTTFVALEGVGVGEWVVYLTGEGVLRRTAFSAKALALAERAAERCRESGLEIGARHHRGGPTEMGLIVRSGLEGITINAWPRDWPGVARRRRVDDAFDTVQEETLAQAHSFAWTLLQEIDTEPQKT